MKKSLRNIIVLSLATVLVYACKSREEKNNETTIANVIETTSSEINSHEPQNPILSNIVENYSGNQNNSSIVIDYELPLAPGYFPPGMVDEARRYFKDNNKEFKYIIYDISADGTAFNTILVPAVPLLTTSTVNFMSSITGVGFTRTYTSGFQRDGKTLYPKEYEYTGTPKEGWNILYSRTTKIKSNITGEFRGYEWSPYLNGTLGITVSDEAMNRIVDVLKMIRGEKEMDPSLSEKLGKQK